MESEKFIAHHERDKQTSYNNELPVTMNTTENLFQESIQQYQELIQLTLDLNNNWAALSPEKILECCEQIQQLQGRLAKLDKFIVDVMISSGPQILETPSIGEYQKTLDKAMQSYDHIAYKAQTLRASLTTEAGV